MYKKDTVFSIWIEESLNQNKLIVGIGKAGVRVLVNADRKITTGGSIPSQYEEQEGKLFYWWDDEKDLTEEILDVLEKYNVLQDDDGGAIAFPDIEFDDRQKGARYYFCKNDLRKYKKVTTNKGVYPPPKLDCN